MKINRIKNCLYKRIKDTITFKTQRRTNIIGEYFLFRLALIHSEILTQHDNY